jgi:hypothetical protein
MKPILVLVPLLLLISACGGGSDSSVSNISNQIGDTTPAPPPASTAETTALSTHTFEMFTSSEMTIYNATDQIVTLTLFDEDQSRLFQTAIAGQEEQLINFDMAVGIDQLTIQWTGYSPTSDNYETKIVALDTDSMRVQFDGFN